MVTGGLESDVVLCASGDNDTSSTSCSVLAKIIELLFISLALALCFFHSRVTGYCYYQKFVLTQSRRRRLEAKGRNSLYHSFTGAKLSFFSLMPLLITEFHINIFYFTSLLSNQSTLPISKNLKIKTSNVHNFNMRLRR